MPSSNFFISESIFASFSLLSCSIFFIFVSNI